ncbi:tetratricopeptide repeat protein [Streptomyces erythrochromogenes]|uniref:tetratricopeptide repeat protein n=1 Tax=Streptomyces erythrochromogenes TaxID=285574 RepID=UPI0037FECA81
MKLFRWRGRGEAGRATTTPLAQATALYQAGRYAEAEAEARSVAAARSRPRNDTYAPLALGIAALAAGAQGRHADAVTTYDALLPTFGRIFGAEHPQTLKLRSDRAQALSSLARYAECEEECAAVVRAAVRGTGPDMLLMATAARNGQIYALAALGRHPEAEALAREALAARRAPDRFTLVLRLGLARSLNGQGRHEEALDEAERAEALCRRLPQDQRRPETGAVELAVATALLGLGRGADARPLVAAAQEACLAAFGPAHRRTAEAEALLGRIDSA